MHIVFTFRTNAKVNAMIISANHPSICSGYKVNAIIISTNQPSICSGNSTADILCELPHSKGQGEGGVVEENE